MSVSKCGVGGGLKIPPVTKMTLPSKLPMSFAGSNVTPMPTLVIVSMVSGSMKPDPSSRTTCINSRIWRNRFDAKAESDWRFCGAGDRVDIARKAGRAVRQNERD